MALGGKIKESSLNEGKSPSFSFQGGKPKEAHMAGGKSHLTKKE